MIFSTGNQSREKILNRQKAESAAARLPALMIRAEKSVASLLHGEHNQRKSGAGVQFWQFREYAQGDRPQDIDWRQSAKTSHIYIRQKERQTPQSTLFWCANTPGMHFRSSSAWPEKREAAQVLSLALALLVTRAGDQAAPLGAMRAGRSEAALQRLGNFLFEETADLPEAGFYKIPKNAVLIQAGDFLSPKQKIETAFRGLSAFTARGILIQILDPAEIDLPYEGRTVFEDSGAAHRQQIENAAGIREAYKNRIEDHLRFLHEICAQYGWTYILHRTDTPYETTLSSLWQGMSAR